MRTCILTTGEPERIGFISTRFHGTDGVTLEARKWAHVQTGTGHSCHGMAQGGVWRCGWMRPKQDGRLRSRPIANETREDESIVAFNALTTQTNFGRRGRHGERDGADARGKCRRHQTGAQLTHERNPAVRTTDRATLNARRRVVVRHETPRSPQGGRPVEAAA